MELKEFIKQTIIQLTDGLREGHKYIEDNKFGCGVKDDVYEAINFDIAVTSKDESTSKASNVSRIQFKIYLGIKTRQ